MTTTISRRTVLAAMGAAAGTALTAPWVARFAHAEAERTLRFSSLFNKDHASSKSSAHFAEKVAEKTNGRVAVQVFYDASLGNEAQTGEGIRTGSIDIGFAGQVGFGSYIRDIRVLELPYLYKNFDEIDRVYQEIRPILDQRFSENGVTLLSQVYEGPRMTLAARPLAKLEDFSGMALRVPESPVYISMAQAFGTKPTPVAFPEIYTALQAGVVEGLEGSPSTLLGGKFFEVAKNLCRTDHIHNAVYFGINPTTMSSFDEPTQTAILEAAREATLFNLDLVKGSVESDLVKLREAGVTETTPDLEPFRQAVAASNLAFAEGLGGTPLELFKTVKGITG